MMRLRLIVAGLVVSVILAFGIRECRNRQIVASETIQANQHAVQAIDHANQGGVHDQIAEGLKAQLAAEKAEVARLKARLVKLQSSKPDAVVEPIPGIGNPPAETSSQVKDQIIEAQDAYIVSLEAQTGELTASRDAWRNAAGEYKAESEHLLKALAHVPISHRWAAGIAYGTDQSAGVWAEYNFGPVRVGLDVVRRPLDIAGRTSLEGIARIGWRF